MSFLKNARGKDRDAGGKSERNDANAPNEDSQVADILTPFAGGLTTSCSVSLNAAVDDPMAQVWRGTAPDAILNHFRGVRRELMVSLDEVMAQGKAPIILVTSPLPGDGKTFVAASIARTFANAPNYHVTLLDLDLMRRTTSRLFNARQLPGVSDCLLGRTDLRSVICTTDVPRLSFVPAGSFAADNREAFVGTNLDELLARLRKSGPEDLHILDAPPVIPIVETAVLAGKVDLVVVVVRAGLTPRPAIEEAIARLGSNARICIVLNGVTQHFLGKSYDYAYAAYGSAAQD